MLISVTLRLHCYIMHLIYWHYLHKFHAQFVFQVFFLYSPTLKEFVTPGITTFCLDYFLLHKHSPIYYQLAKTAEQAEFLPEAATESINIQVPKDAN